MKTEDKVPADVRMAAKWMREYGPAHLHPIDCQCGGSCSGQKMARWILGLPAPTAATGETYAKHVCDNRCLEDGHHAWPSPTGE